MVFAFISRVNYFVLAPATVTHSCVNVKAGVLSLICQALGLCFEMLYVLNIFKSIQFLLYY